MCSVGQHEKETIGRSYKLLFQGIIKKIIARFIIVLIIVQIILAVENTFFISTLL